MVTKMSEIIGVIIHAGLVVRAFHLCSKLFVHVIIMTFKLCCKRLLLIC